MELKDVPSTIRWIDSPNTCATSIISNLSKILFFSNSIVLHTITLDISDAFNRSIAGPDNTGCVATATTDKAPLSIAVLAALQIVPAVSIISSIIKTCLFLRLPTKFAAIAWFALGLLLSINAKEIPKVFKENTRFKEIIPISVKKKNNLKELLSSARQFLPLQEFIYDDDQITDKNEKFLAAEIIREKIFRLTGQELPYSVAVEIEKFEHEGNVRRIFAAIIVERDAHKPMIIGNKGIKLKEISTNARVDLEKLFCGKVWLETWVKVQKGWSDDLRALKSLGL